MAPLLTDFCFNYSIWREKRELLWLGCFSLNKHRKLHKNLSVEANLREFVMQTKHFSTKILRNSIFSYWYLDQVWTNFVKSFWGLTKHLIKASTPITMFLMGKVLLSSGCSWHIFFFLLKNDSDSGIVASSRAKLSILKCAGCKIE